MSNNTIKIKRTSVAGRVPNTSQLTAGELGLNMADQILYASNGTVVFPIGSTDKLSSNGFIFQLNANGDVTLANASSLQLNGSVGTNGQLITSNGSATIWTDPSTSANSATYLGGNTASDLRTYSDQKAGNAYSNSVTYVNTQSYVNTSQLSSNLSNFALLSGAVFTGNTSANNGNVSFDFAVGRDLFVGGNTFVSGNLIVSGNLVTLNVQNLAVEDNMIYLNNGSVVLNPDLGFAGNYNDGTYHHAGFFRDHATGTWKVFDNYKPEPDASVFIDQANDTFHVANFQANTLFVGNNSVFATINTTSFTGQANSSAYVISPYKVLNANYSVLASDSVLLANAALTLTLPVASTVNGASYEIKNINNGAVTIVGSGSDLIDGYANMIITFKNSMLGVLSTGSGWIVF